ncbi:MAG: glycosyltransferase family 4 protein [Pseudomonadota bacterium]|nr:glycosyltransferase family 4 protein [Pseudomonadota bacterium]MDP1903402.1 glycosyltransferase family 4 protein [Pseudomonadota bacterium]MDP2352372.1 glycosyltransferase family 4 protein [Pseudomonadota bacterium]
MKLALVRQRYTPFGGAERFLERALAALGRDDLEVTVIASDWPGAAETAYRRILVRPFSLGRTWRDAAFARAACHVVASGGFDLVQSHERLPCCDIFRAGDGVHREWLIQRARRRSGAATLLDQASPFHRRILAAERTLFASPRLKAVICNSHMVRDEIVRHYGVAEARLTVIRNAVDGGVFHPGLRDRYRADVRQQLNLSDDHPLFLFVGSGFERKGVDLLLDLWPEVDATLLVVGRDRDLTGYRRRARGLRGRVRFIGPQEDVCPWYGAADAFVLPTLYDPLPNAALEALACGLPVLTSRKCGAAELIRPGVNGDVADALDRAAWLALLKTWRDLARCRAAASHATQAVHHLTPESMQIELRDLYARLLSPS